MALAAQQLAVPVPRKSAEWGWLEYLLTVSCQTTKLRVRGAWSVLNHRLALEFSQRCKGLLTLHAWFPVADLPDDVPIQEVFQKGFRAGAGGVPFHIGNIRLPETVGGGSKAHQDASGQPNPRGHPVSRRGRNLPSGRRLYEFVLCRVGVGRSMLIERPEAAETLDLPPEYDSFFVKHDVGDSQQILHLDIEGVLPHHAMHHEYIVRDPAQALPLFLVHFEYDPEAPEKLALPVCDNCGQKAALIYCEADHACFCESCDQRIHAVNSIAQKHVRMPINEKPGSSLGECPEHPGQEADEYCIECQVPLCAECKTLGSHGAGAAMKHARVHIVDAYRSTQQEPMSSTAIGLSRQEIEQRLQQLDGKLEAVQRSGRALEDRAYDAVQQAVNQGRDVAEDQASKVLSDQLNVKLQLDLSAWLESFSEEYLKSLPPPDFLHSWNQHCLARADFARLGLLAPARPPVTLRTEGRLRVTTAPSRPSANTPRSALKSPGGRAEVRASPRMPPQLQS
eukprot:TRINITY_DN23775_c0_g1_i1.p1 TRINITY_DN23775_c0_g1~~TRINITY_DN23775_c0_g1_i1.p1  ORF type:complete len:508 (-),score=94.28 TRINITY_DN23775_c0_g1_i1:126-1649(-)